MVRRLEALRSRDRHSDLFHMRIRGSIYAHKPNSKSNWVTFKANGPPSHLGWILSGILADKNNIQIFKFCLGKMQSKWSASESEYMRIAEVSVYQYTGINRFWMTISTAKQFCPLYEEIAFNSPLIQQRDTKHIQRFT